jgi:acyl dehydratase
MKVKQGEVITRRKLFDQSDFDTFAVLSGDDNPIHVDPAFSAATRFGQTVAHGMLLYGHLCSLLSQHYPEAVQLDQDFVFPSPTFTGQEMTFRAEVIEIIMSREQARLATSITNPAGEVLCHGHTLLWWPES